MELKRKVYTPQFKLQSVQMVTDHEGCPTSVSRVMRLTFDFTLGPDDTLLFGPTDRLGQAYFRPDGARQRVLIVRALRPEGIVKLKTMKG